MSRREQGFGIFEVIVLVAGVAILAAIGILAYNNFMAAKPVDKANTAEHVDMKHTPKIPTISSTADLDKAVAALDDPMFNDDGMDEIEAEASSF